MEDELDEDDPRAAALLESYEHMLVDLEIGEDIAIAPVSDTEQATIVGGPVKASVGKKPTRGTESRRLAVQTNLTEYVGHPQEGAASKHVPMPSRPRSRAGRSPAKRESTKRAHK